MKKECNVDGCDQPVKGREMCNLHYGRWYRNGSTDKIHRSKSQDKCLFVGCEKVYFAKGFCQKHYDQRRNAGNSKVKVPVCSVDGCNEFPVSGKVSLKNRFCPAHWDEKYLDSATPYTHGYIDKNGYRVVGLLGKKVLEHRVIMERSLGRRLVENETVHHINGQRSDNRLENLELWSHSQPYGQRIMEKLEWAKDFVATYDVPMLYPGLRGSTFSELEADIPYATGPELHVLSAEIYPGVNIYTPGRHQYQTDTPGGDALITITDASCGMKDFEFKHTDFFEDIELKRNYSSMETKTLMKDLLGVLRDERLECHADSALPGIRPHLLLAAMQVLSVIEHRRYSKWEAKFGGRFLFPRFMFGIAEGLWSAEQCAKLQKSGRPGVERLEKSHGIPVLTKELMENA